MKSYLTALKKYFVFSGRASRTEFWMFTLFLTIFLCVGLAIDMAIGGDAEMPFGLFSGLIFTAHLVPAISVTIRRLHDSNKSGWMILLGVIPIITLILMLLPSTPGANKYEPNPKGEHGPGNPDERVVTANA